MALVNVAQKNRVNKRLSKYEQTYCSCENFLSESLWPLAIFASKGMSIEKFKPYKVIKN